MKPRRILIGSESVLKPVDPVIMPAGVVEYVKAKKGRRRGKKLPTDAFGRDLLTKMYIAYEQERERKSGVVKGLVDGRQIFVNMPTHEKMRSNEVTTGLIDLSCSDLHDEVPSGCSAIWYALDWMPDVGCREDHVWSVTYRRAGSLVDLFFRMDIDPALIRIAWIDRHPVTCAVRPINRCTFTQYGPREYFIPRPNFIYVSDPYC